MIYKKIFFIVITIALFCSAGCGNAGNNNDILGDDLDMDIADDSEMGITEIDINEDINTNEGNLADDITADEAFINVKLDTLLTYQVIESFGTSSAWWSQYAGGWDNQYKETGRSVRDEIAMLLFDKDYGIGLTCYRYNLGAGSKESGKGNYWNEYRRASSFETNPLIYNWNRDANAVWFLKKATELGVEEVVLFCNSPLERITINMMAQMTKGTKENILSENYDEFARYVCDVAEHFISEGIPVKFLSPINEPQWEWHDGQEGCHYEPVKITGLYKAFLSEMELRPLLSGVELSGPESGEWGGDAILYTSALLNDSILSEHFTTIDNHSYWTDSSAKKAFRRWMDANHPDIKLRTSEWCEMVNGSDVTMDSAFSLAKVLAEDLTLLNVVSWQNWVAAAPGGYRDGLIYINQEKKTLNPLKRLWGYGNYTRYIRPGYIRIDASTDKEYAELMPVAFTGINEAGNEELVLVLINKNNSKKQVKLEFPNNLLYNYVAVYETSPDKSLECIYEGSYTSGLIELNSESITTIILSKKH